MAAPIRVLPSLVRQSTPVGLGCGVHERTETPGRICQMPSRGAGSVGVAAPACPALQSKRPAGDSARHTPSLCAAPPAPPSSVSKAVSLSPEAPLHTTHPRRPSLAAAQHPSLFPRQAPAAISLKPRAHRAARPASSPPGPPPKGARPIQHLPLNLLLRTPPRRRPPGPLERHMAPPSPYYCSAARMISRGRHSCCGTVPGKRRPLADL